MSREAVEACTALCARYAYCCDRDRAKVAGLFTEDAVLELVGRTMRGRAEISEGMKPRPGVVTLHFCANTVIDVEDEDNARGSTHLLSLGHEGEVTELSLADAGGSHRRHLFRPLPQGRRRLALQRAAPGADLQRSALMTTMVPE